MHAVWGFEYEDWLGGACRDDGGWVSKRDSDYRDLRLYVGFHIWTKLCYQWVHRIDL